MRKIQKKIVCIGVYCSLMIISCGKKPEKISSLEKPTTCIKKIKSQDIDFETYQARGRFKINKEGKKYKVSGSLTVVKDEKMVIKINGFLVPSVWIFVTKEKFILYIPSERKAYEGDPTEAINKVFGILISPSDWMRYLSGYLPQKVMDLDWKIKKQKKDEITLKKKEIFASMNLEGCWMQSVENLYGSKTKIVRSPQLNLNELQKIQFNHGKSGLVWETSKYKKLNQKVEIEPNLPKSTNIYPIGALRL